MRYVVVEDEKDFLPDANKTLHQRVARYDIDPLNNEAEKDSPFIITEISPKKKDLTAYDKFSGEFSIVPHDDFYNGEWSKVKSTMTFSFINDEDKLVGK